MKQAVVLAVCLAVIGAAAAHPGKNEPAQGKSRQTLLPSAKELHSKEKDQDAAGASPRFGFLSNSIYPGTYSTGTGQYGATSPLKLDLGGLLVGGAIGLGLIFLVPKLFYPYGARDCYSNYQARSTDGEQESAAVAFLSKLNDALASNQIDAASCAQRALCTFVQKASEKVKGGVASDYEKVISDITSQATSENIFNSSEYQRALEVGRSNGDCAAEFKSCKSDSDNVMGAVKTFLMSVIF